MGSSGYPVTGFGELGWWPSRQLQSDEQARKAKAKADPKEV